MSSEWRQHSQAIYLLAGQPLQGSVLACPCGQLEAAARGEDNASHSVCNEGLGMVQGKSGRGKLKASCNQSRFPGVNRVSVRLKISLLVAEPSHGAGEEPQLAPGWLMPRVAPQEGLWLLRRFVASGTFLTL